jgi:hypothetical protein
MFFYFLKFKIAGCLAGIAGSFFSRAGSFFSRAVLHRPPAVLHGFGAGSFFISISHFF